MKPANKSGSRLSSIDSSALPPPEAFTYDADGNLTSDGRWTNRWDAENRLISMESLTNGPAGSRLKLLFGYDYMGRRMSKTVSNWTGASWALVSDHRFAYGQWNLIPGYDCPQLAFPTKTLRRSER